MSENKNSEENSSSPQSEWLSYWENAIAGEKELELQEQYAILIVLEGEITLIFNSNENRTVGSESLIMINRRQLTDFKWTAGAAVLKYTPPAKIFRFFDSYSTAFNIPCSATVPVLPNLQQWVDDLMAELLQPKEMLTETHRRDYCMRLATILQSYPPLLVGELLVPFHACSISGQVRCQGKSCR